MAINEFFTWGAGGAKKTPAQVAREREIAETILMRAGNTSPVGHWTQGAARVVDALGGVLKERRAAAGEADIASRNKALVSPILAALTGGSTATAPSSIPMNSAAGEVAATAPSQPIDMTGNEVYNEFIGAAREGGLTNPFGLAALAATGKAESGFDPGNVNRTWSDPSQSGQPGTAGGILSWRGPRYQALAATGDLSPAGQARFFLQEDPGLVQALNNAKSIEEAQGLINNAWKFAGYDRADGETARRLGMARSFLPTFQGGGEVAAATPEAAIEAIAPLQPVERGPLQSYAGQERAAPASLSEEVAAYQQTPEYAAAFPGRAQPAQVAAPVQVAGGDRVPMATPSINPAIIEALTAPQATPQTQMLARIVLEQQQRQAQAAEEQRLQAADPMRRIQLERAQLELEALRNPQPERQPLINAGSGNVYDPNTQQWIQAPGGGQQQFRAATPEEAQRMGAAAGQFGPDGRFYPLNPPQGTSLSVDPNTGAVTFNQGAGVKPLTEGQSKDTVFATRASGALPLIDQFGDSLLGLEGGVGATVGQIPVIGNLMKSEGFQKAEQAGKEFLQAILRKDTGAAISKEETGEYGSVYLPQIGDGPEVLEQKRQSRQRALQAIQAGMPPQAILNMEKALLSGQSGAPQPQPSTEGPRRLKFNPATGELE